MLGLIIVQEAVGATTTWLIIEIAREIATEQISAMAFVEIIVTQTLSLLAGAVSWVFAERAGFAAYGHYMLDFARRNRFQTALLGDAHARERVEPFLTSETFDICFDLIYNCQFYLRLSSQLLFNSLVLGFEIDAGLPMAFCGALVILLALQWRLREPLASVFLRNQRLTNRLRARTYNAWDNVLSGNRYNHRIWNRDFRHRLSDALSAQTRAIVAREGWSAVSGIIALVVVLSTTAWVAVQDAGNTELLMALAATLPRQMDMALDMHQLAAGITDLLAVWTRIKGVCSHMQPEPDPGFIGRIDFDRVLLKEGDDAHVCASLAAAVSHVLARPTGLVAVRGANGSGKSTLLAALKHHLRGRAFYWPMHDRLSFHFNSSDVDGDHPSLDPGANDPPDDEGADETHPFGAAVRRPSHSSGERQLQILQEIVAQTDHPVYLLDEWDANLDPGNRALACELVERLACRARVVEISHRDRNRD
ncbi:AAA family ATPase [Accumulibacter sp.]|uniref:AAA family ATPase n=1 Tax=Accumulibacter sp. TaxID=2053492 RepID=UPI0025F1E0AF|nr:AAA family ATPase [Accumulibacter sp.]MCM8612524.1 AAA family ATPase [Accumulibacter sp.]MCM8636445.1 AAA family ATPase [Accumulibacter sp.]MCM8640156.1 AAA family ATPase [Accumulibacter sp.]